MSGRLRRTLQMLLHLEDTPHRTAVAFGLGLWLAFFPLLGIHTGLALLIAFLFRLNRAALLVGVYFSNPWTVAPLYVAGTMLGCAVLGIPTEGLEQIDWSLHGAEFYRALGATLRPYIWPFVVGNTILGVLAGVVGYVALRFVLERKRAPKALASSPPR
jgi:uncharacterized protein (DUF2062 family)